MRLYPAHHMTKIAQRCLLLSYFLAISLRCQAKSVSERDDGRQLPQNASNQLLGLGRQTPTLIVAEAKPFASQLLPLDSLLLF